MSSAGADCSGSSAAGANCGGTLAVLLLFGVEVADIPFTQNIYTSVAILNGLCNSYALGCFFTSYYLSEARKPLRLVWFRRRLTDFFLVLYRLAVPVSSFCSSGIADIRLVLPWIFRAKLRWRIFQARVSGFIGSVKTYHGTQKSIYVHHIGYKYYCPQ